MTHNSPSQRALWQRRLSALALTLVFGVILAGGVVRTTGSGMGCPDWPKCFGQYIPPTDVSQLPPDYKIIFAVKGKEIADFDAFKTWIEYVNRLLGALLGVGVFAMLLSSVFSFRQDKLLFALSFILFLTTGFVGWLGSVVVASDLEPFKITIHLAGAAAITVLAVSVFDRARHSPLNTFSSNNPSQNDTQNKQQQNAIERRIFWILAAAIALSVAQILTGTQVREEIDIIAKSLDGRGRELWIESLSSIFPVHRSSSWAVVAVNGFLLWKLLGVVGAENDRFALTLRRLSMALASLIVAEILLGVTMKYFAIPKFAQPLHLLGAMGIIAVQWRMALVWKKRLKNT
jgi:cytochrome c oxidase assembly protein subunit 15